MLAQEEFGRQLSHELRTPLTAISGYAELLTAGDCLSDCQLGFVDAIARNAARLTALADDLTHVRDDLVGHDLALV